MYICTTLAPMQIANYRR